MLRRIWRVVFWKWTALTRRLYLTAGFRRIITNNFRSPYLAVGQPNNVSYNIKKWITVDLKGADFNFDLRTKSRLPFADSSKKVIYSAHMIEHLDDDTLTYFFSECFRLLEKSGCIRLEAPNFTKILEAYKDKSYNFLDAILDEYKKEKADPIYHERHIAFNALISCYIQEGDSHHTPVMPTREEFEHQLNNLEPEAFGKWCVSLQSKEQQRSGGHINCITYEKLLVMLKNAGFSSIKRVDFGVTNIKKIAWSAIESEGVRPQLSLFVEAQKA